MTQGKIIDSLTSKRGRHSANRMYHMKRILIGIVAVACSVSLAVDFKPPSPQERIKAVGSTESLPPILKKAFEPADDFDPIPVPKPGDWLAVHPETAQPFDRFVKSGPNRPDKKRNKIYLQPLGSFPQDPNHFVPLLQDYAAAYFGMEVRRLKALALEDKKLTTRINSYTGKRQILTRDVLDLLKDNLPADAFCILAITMEDLYPQPSWNFVFGQASLRRRVGVYSFARYDPAFYGHPRGGDYEKILLRRSCKVLVHETAHMFGLTHCVFFNCVVNGSNHLAESDRRPLHVCPVCLRKLHHSTGFDVTTRYRGLYDFYRKVGFDDDARWVKERLEFILGPDAAKQFIQRQSSHLWTPKPEKSS